MPDSKGPEGWGFTRHSRKAHYFRENTSLCRKYGFYFGPVEADTFPSKDDCVDCRRRLDKEKLSVEARNEQ